MKQRQGKQFHRSFYVANTMEIFERLAWYGFFTVSSLYMTTPRTQGGLGLSDEERGFLQGIVPFVLYILPVFTGALADRYGYRKMFIVSSLVMAPSYFLLGKMHSFWPFCAVFVLVAVGAAIFKPVAIGTVGRTTDDSNRGLGFGIFYMMVNVGGFLGPIVAGYVRAISWDLVFTMSSFWVAINLIPAIFLYREPAATGSDTRSLKTVLADSREVLGNVRLLVLIVPALAVVMYFIKTAGSFLVLLSVLLAWIGGNMAWSFLVRNSRSGNWHAQPVRVGDRRFVAYLLILSVFWAVYYQLFLTLPLFIKDFVDTGDLVRFFTAVSPRAADVLAHVNLDEVKALLASVQQRPPTSDAIMEVSRSLANLRILVPDDVLHGSLGALQSGRTDADSLAQHLAATYRQIAPEYMINIEFLIIIVCQIGVSVFARRFRALPVLVFGVLTLMVSLIVIGLSAGSAYGGAIVLGAIAVFAIAETIVSPKSQEFVSAVSPPGKTAMFMGYYFISMALGSLLAGVLSGWAYSSIAKGLHQPLLMWSGFALLALASAVAMLVLDRKTRD
ncbi:MFS transporter [Massilia sp. CCM 8733]|uniref:MFS transporter n=1 Tax=Massilia mucilaginosa TaxID=2609282 RepID=A0ABX0NRT5_9BURK|nr:MFS transporter [Massilia mucilaginosa]NHZ89601.1 MFS transporter [Massilia mucilaginosa]